MPVPEDTELVDSDTRVEDEVSGSQLLCVASVKVVEVSPLAELVLKINVSIPSIDLMASLGPSLRYTWRDQDTCSISRRV